MIVAVASENPVKLRAAGGAFRRAFPHDVIDVVAAPVSSGVSAQPTTDAETLLGAQRRADACRAAWPTADYVVGIEGGVDRIEGGLAAFAWVVVQGGDRYGRARTGAFILPPAVARLIDEGLELGDADDRIFGQQGSKREQGAVGLLSGGLIDRAAFYEHAVVLSLIPFRRIDLYSRCCGEQPESEPGGR